MFPSVLIVDDEPSILQSLGGLLSDEGFEVLTASNGYEGLKSIAEQAPDMVLLDIWMPGIDGIDTLQEIRKNHPQTQVIIITGHGNIETAVRATKLGAFDLIEKPLSIDKVIVTINNALNFRRLEEENRYLRKKTLEKHAINGNSPAVQALKKQIAAVAPTDSWVLITGENGAGKELVARMIHQFSPRAEASLIAVNCAAIAQEEMEAEMFGQEKNQDCNRKRGKLELANGGTLFLDEVGDMRAAIQAKILRVLEQGQFQRLGGGRPLTTDIRVIAATNKDLEAEIQAGGFREDLYYRLNVVPIQVPALRERPEDIPILAETFLAEYARKNEGRKKALSPEALSILQGYSWPGNVRELKNLMGRLSILVDSEIIQPSDLPAPYHGTDPGMTNDSGLFTAPDLDSARQRFERAFILRKLSENQEDLAETAQSLGLSLEQLKQKLSALEISGCE